MLNCQMDLILDHQIKNENNLEYESVYTSSAHTAHL